ncbi:hypothetical protein MKEN_01137900 [Mycena kentingensis (nom. inval.)]|nr:hypothetical protein MKEN_01137900 [Mycena kentingensis (nom. inval.)]
MPSWLLSPGFLLWSVMDLFRRLGTVVRRIFWPARMRLEDLDGDVLSLVFDSLPFTERLAATTLSRRMREVLAPGVLSRVRWAPLRTDFPPEALWPYIQDLHISGEPDSHNTRSELDYDAIVACLRSCFPLLRKLGTFTLSAIPGGLWPELLESLPLAPNLHLLVLEANWWPPKVDAPFLLPIVPTPFTFVGYSFTLASNPLTGQPARRSPNVTNVEGANLRQVLSGCHASLERAYIPGDLLLRAMDLSLDWTALTSLFVEGIWPMDAPERAPPLAPLSPRSERTDSPPPVEQMQSPILVLLEALPSLRVLFLDISAMLDEVDVMTTELIGQHHAPPQNPAGFLRYLEVLKLASYRDNDRFLTFLPRCLRQLSLVQYPLEPSDTIWQPLLLATELLSLLENVDFPDLEVLQIWYTVATAQDADAEAGIFALVPVKFPRLRKILFWRQWIDDEEELTGLWDPTFKLKAMCSKLPELQDLRVNPDVPDPISGTPFQRPVPEFYASIARLRGMAQEIVSECPSLRVVALYTNAVNIHMSYSWEVWDVLLGPAGEVQLRDRPTYHGLTISELERLNPPE